MKHGGELQILVGGVASGKTAAALREFHATLSRTPLSGHARALWLAPALDAAQDVRDRLAGMGSAFLDPGVTTFADLAAGLVRQSNLRLRRLSALQRRLLLRRIIDQAARDKDLSYFGGVADTAGFLSLVEAAISQRKQAAVKPRPDAASAGGRGGDIERLYSRYENALSASGLVDDEGMLWQGRALVDRQPEDAWPLELVVVAGFTDFTQAEFNVLESLVNRSQRTIVTLLGEAEWAEENVLRPAAATSQAHYGKIVRTFERLRTLGPVAVTGMPAATGWPAMAHVRRNLFRDFHQLESPPADTAASASRIRIVAASGVHAEIHEIARRVKLLLLDGAVPDEIVVAFRSTHAVADRVRQVFDDFGIPFWIDCPRRLESSPLVRTLIEVLRLAIEDWPYRRVLRLATNRSLGMIDQPLLAEDKDGDSPLGGAEVRAAIERCLRHAQLPSGRRLLFDQLAAWAGRDDDCREPTPTTARVAARALETLAAALDTLPTKARLPDWIAAVDELARALHLAPGCDEDEAACEALGRGLQGVVQLDQWTGGEGVLSLEEFATLLATMASQLVWSGSHDAVGRVRVLGAERARHSRPRHLLLGGLSEEAFAAKARRAASADELDETPEREPAADEMLLFYQLAVCPSETLTLSYPALDEKAQPLAASPYLIELDRCLAGLPVERVTQPLSYGTASNGPAASRSDLRRAAVVQAMERKRGLLASVAAASDTGRSILAGINAVAERANRRKFGQFEGLLTGVAAGRQLEALYGGEHLWSPSQLETYAQCPFRFFGEQILKLQPTPELALESDVQRRGSLLHDTLARLYGQLVALREAQPDGQAEPIDPAGEAQLVVEWFRVMLDEACGPRAGRGLDAALREIERRQVADWAEKFAQQDADYRANWRGLDEPPTPRHFEVRFGPGSRRNASPSDATLSTEAPFELALGEEGSEVIRLTGQIDRIDLGRVGDKVVFNVIDYKSSIRTLVDQAKMRTGAQLQLPLYVMAAEQLLAGMGAVPLSAGYWSVRGAGFKSSGRTRSTLDVHTVQDGQLTAATAWDDLRKDIVERIAALVGGIRQGQFPVFNDDPQCTRYCSLRTVCRIAQVRSLEKQWPSNGGSTEGPSA